jgi:hypothetical protein
VGFDVNFSFFFRLSILHLQFAKLSQHTPMFGHFSADRIPWGGGTKQAETVDFRSLVADADRSQTGR